jgi:hypothetical protein
MSRFSLDAVAFAATTFKLDKDLLGDKECNATGAVGKRGSYVV